MKGAGQFEEEVTEYKWSNQGSAEEGGIFREGGKCRTRMGEGKMTVKIPEKAVKDQTLN